MDNTSKTSPTPVDLVIDMDDRDMKTYGTIHKAGCRDARDPEPIGAATHRDQAGELANAITSWDDDLDHPLQWKIAPCAASRLKGPKQPKSRLHNLAANLPEFTDNPVDRLAHTLAAYADTPDSGWALIATSHAIPGQDTTGITWGDLRALLNQIRTGDE